MQYRPLFARTLPRHALHPEGYLPRYSPLPVDRRNDTRLRKHYLPATTVAGGNKQNLITQVDESLFGAPHRETKRAEMLEEKRRPANIEEQARQRSAKREKARANKKETIQVVTKDLIRNLV